MISNSLVMPRPSQVEAIPPLNGNIVQDRNAANADIVFVGGGPVALWTACQMQALTKRKIVVIEKYTEYQRKDIQLNINEGSFAGAATNCPALKELINTWKKQKRVSILEMEQSLAQKAHDLGITIIKGFRAEPKDLPTLFRKAKVFVGADGARSTVREEIFGNKFRFDSTLQYIAQVQYLAHRTDQEEEEKGSFQKVKGLSEHYRKLKLAGHVIEERVEQLNSDPGKKSNLYLITLQIFIDKATYEPISGSTFRNPHRFAESWQLPSSLEKTLKYWLGTRPKDETPVKASKDNKMSVIILKSYAADEVVLEEDGRIWTLVGDAAAGFPFFRAINNGLLMGSNLAKCVTKAFDNTQTKKSEEISISDFRSYSRYATWRVYRERIVAFIKNLFISMSRWWVHVSSRVPWEMNKYSQAQREEIELKGTENWSLLTYEPPYNDFDFHAEVGQKAAVNAAQREAQPEKTPKDHCVAEAPQSQYITETLKSPPIQDSGEGLGPL